MIDKSMRKTTHRRIIFKIVGAIFGVGVALAILCGLMVSSNSPLFNAFVVGKYLTTWGHSAFPGGEGWLFFRQDLRVILKPWFHMRNNLERIAALNDTLNKSGIKLLFVPVPDKCTSSKGFGQKFV